MLTIKGPMRLQSISVLRISPDILGEKIAANYRLIGTELTSADLLHMAVQKPEQFVNMEYHGMLAVENHLHSDNRIKLELVNQLVNRLMFCFTPEFTYQDEVFVASVLQKMGIMDVNEFVRQVHQHMDRNVLLNELINHYFSYGSDISSVVEAYCDRFHTMYRTELQEFYDKENQFARYLHKHIFERLMTAECNNIIYSYHYPAVQGIREAVWIEQADAIQLSQLREILFHQTNPADWQSDMHYEMKAFSQSELTEEKVVRCIAAAVLENMAQKIHRGRLQYHDRDRAEWKDYTRAFYQSAEEVFERFWYFHGEKNVDIRQRQVYAQCMTELIQDERMLAQLLEEKKDHQDSTADIVLAVWENQTIQKQLAEKMRFEERLVDRTDRRDMDLADITECREALRVFQEINQIFRHERVVQRSRPGQDVQAILQGKQTDMEQNDPGGVSQEQREEWARDHSWQQEVSGRVKELQEQGTELVWDISQPLEVNERAKELIREVTKQQEAYEQAKGSQDRGQELEWDISEQQEVSEYVKEIQEQGQELALDISEQQEVSDRLRISQEQVQNILQQQEMPANRDFSDLQETYGQQNESEMVHRQDLQEHQHTSYNYMNEFLSQYGEFVSDRNVPFAENVRLLEQINQHNLYMKQLLDSEEAAVSGKEQSASKRVVVDQAKARQSALRAMENPQEVLREVYENASAIERETPREIEKILRITDEKTRQFYRRLLGYDKEPGIVVQNNDRNNMEGLERYPSGENKDVLFYADHRKQDEHSHDSSVIENAIADYIIGDKADVVQNNIVQPVAREMDIVRTMKYNADEINIVDSDVIRNNGNEPDQNSALKYHSNVLKGNDSDVAKYSDEQNYIGSNTVKYNDESNHVESNALKYYSNTSDQNESDIRKYSDDEPDHIRSNVVKYSGDEPDRNESAAIEYSGGESDRIDGNVVKYNRDEVTLIHALDVLNEYAGQESVRQEHANKEHTNKEHVYNEKNGIKMIHTLDALNERIRKEHVPAEHTPKEHAYSEDKGTKTETAVDAVLERIAQRADRIYREQIDFVTLDSTEDREHMEFLKKQEYMKNGKYIEKSEFMKNQEFTESEPYIETEAFHEGSGFCKIDFVHKPEQQSLDSSELHEDSLSGVIQRKVQADIQIKLQSELEKIRQEQRTQEQLRQEQITQQLMKDIKRKLASESEGQLTQMLNRNLKTQVHEISGIVYHELERRLKNEQRRRGY